MNKLIKSAIVIKFKASVSMNSLAHDLKVPRLKIEKVIRERLLEQDLAHQPRRKTIGEGRASDEEVALIMQYAKGLRR